MPQEQIQTQNVLTMNKDELRQGYVLFEDVPEVPGLVKSRVLTEQDIDLLMKSSINRPIQVIVLNQSVISSGEKVDLTHERPSASETEKKERETIYYEDLQNSLTSKKHAEKIKAHVEDKKKAMRGGDYDRKLDEKKKEQIAKYREQIKNDTSQKRETTLKVIEKYAKSAADLEGLDRIAGIQLPEFVKKLNRYESDAKNFIDAIFKNKFVHTPYVENILVDVMNDFGHNLSLALLGSLYKSVSGGDFLVTHSLQVMLVAIVTAIELNHIVQDKISGLAQDDINTLLQLEKKLFNLDDMVDIGISALLHDVGFIRNIPDMTEDYRFSLRNESQIDLHLSEGLHVVEHLPLDFDVVRAIVQHHERKDGSGFPKGLQSRLFGRFTSIISFAEYFIENTTRNPFISEQRSPRDVMLDTLKNRTAQFDIDVIYAFIRAASMYPIGSWVLLSSGETGLVVESNKGDYEKPVVKAVLDQDQKTIKPRLVDLSKTDARIVKPIDYKKIDAEVYRQIFAS